MKRSRQERQCVLHWMTQIGKDDLAHCPTTALQHAIDTLRNECSWRKHDPLSLRMNTWSPPALPPLSNPREERKRRNRWLARMTREDLKYDDMEVLRTALKVLQCEYDRRHKYTLFRWTPEPSRESCGVALLNNDPRYQYEWKGEIDDYLTARAGKPDIVSPMTEKEVRKFPGEQDLPTWVAGGPAYLKLFDFPDYPTVKDPQAYLKEHIDV